MNENRRLAVQQDQLNSETDVELQSEVQSHLRLNLLILNGMITWRVINGLLHFKRVERFDGLND